MSPGKTPPAAIERPPRVLVVDDDEDIRRLVVTYLQLEGFDVAEAADGGEAVTLAPEMRPELILMDIMMPGMSGTEALERLRADFRTQFTPVVLLTAKSLVQDKVDHLLSGADDYIVKPFDPDELVARCRVVLRRSNALRGLNPITGLPGNVVIDQEISRRLTQEQPFACLYVDLTKFKEYNDHYGFSRGDTVIQMVATALLNALVSIHSSEHFAGHIGGDDFVVLTAPDLAAEVAARIVETFDAAIPALYDPEDRERGWIEIEDRKGQLNRFPMVSVAIGIVFFPNRRFQTAAEVAHDAAQMKSLAKREPASAWVVDRRRDD